MDNWIGNRVMMRGICPACSNAEKERRLFVVVGNVVMVCASCDSAYPKSRDEAWAKLRKSRRAASALLDDTAGTAEGANAVNRMAATERRHEEAYQAYLVHKRTQETVRLPAEEQRRKR
jgi:hypothetical protein